MIFPPSKPELMFVPQGSCWWPSTRTSSCRFTARRWSTRTAGRTWATWTLTYSLWLKRPTSRWAGETGPFHQCLSASCSCDISVSAASEMITELRESSHFMASNYSQELVLMHVGGNTPFKWCFNTAWNSLIDDPTTWNKSVWISSEPISAENTSSNNMKISLRSQSADIKAVGLKWV